MHVCALFVSACVGWMTVLEGSVALQQSGVSSVTLASMCPHVWAEGAPSLCSAITHDFCRRRLWLQLMLGTKKEEGRVLNQISQCSVDINSLFQPAKPRLVSSPPLRQRGKSFRLKRRPSPASLTDRLCCVIVCRAFHRACLPNLIWLVRLWESTAVISLSPYLFDDCWIS